MSRVFDALQQTANRGKNTTATLPWELLLAPPSIANDPSLDPAVQSSDGIQDTTAQAPSLALEPRSEDRLVALQDTHSVAAENIGILAGRLTDLQHGMRFKTLLISSSTTGEGKTVISANLGITLASRDGKRVLLIDGDLRQRTLSRMFRADSGPGLTDCLAKGTPVNDCLRKEATMPLWLLPVGGSAETPLRAEELSRFLASLDDRFDWIMIDSAPMTLLADAAAWSIAAEKFLLIVRRGKTPKELLSKALAAMDREKLLGTVMNDFADRSHAHYAHYYQRAAMVNRNP
jgi:capsular exopolysaccharide synthesis family protein